jgi:paraquat-inducible protein A
MSSRPSHLTCRVCGHEYRPVPLAPGERALCVRCDTVLAHSSRLGPDAGLALTVTGLLLAPPAALLPFVTAGKLGSERSGLLFTGVEGMWDNGMHLLAVWVLLCGALVPVALLVTLAGLLLPARFGWPPLQPELLSRAARALGYWAMPEVQVLAVLVALMKLGNVVNVSIGAGFWCYCAMSFAFLFAWRSFEFQSAAGTPEAARGADTSPP